MGDTKELIELCTEEAASCIGNAYTHYSSPKAFIQCTRGTAQFQSIDEVWVSMIN